jgi:translocator protein
VLVKAVQGKVPRRVAVPFAINLVANLLFMPIFSALSATGRSSLEARF